MASKFKRITFVLTPEMKVILDRLKKEMFYNCSQSEMIRILVEAGCNSIKTDKQCNSTEKNT